MADGPLTSAYFEGQCPDNPQAPGGPTAPISKWRSVWCWIPGFSKAHEVTVRPPDLFADWGQVPADIIQHERVSAEPKRAELIDA
jgi:hypothetical protein